MPAQTPTPRPPVNLRIPFPQDEGSLTPYTFDLAYPLLTLVYDTLTWRDEEGIARPWLARSITRSSDGRQLTIKLVEGARWHDERPVTADDVVFTVRFVAARYHPRFTPQLAAVDGVSAQDPATAVVTLRHPAPGFLDQPLGDLPILPKHIWESVAAGQPAPEGLAIGSGPFRFTDHRPNEGYRFEANREYFRGVPAVGSIDAPIVNDALETVRALERREVDMIPVSLPLDLSRRVEGFGIKVARGPSYLGTTLIFNLRRPPFDRVEARRAVLQAIDLTRITRAVGDAAAADRGYLHPSSPWTPSGLLRRAPGTAQNFSERIGVLAPSNDPIKVEAGRQVVLALQRARIGAELREVSVGELSRRIGEDGSSPDFDAVISVTPALASYDPDFLARVFGSEPREAPLNYMGYRSAAFDGLAGRIAAATDLQARRDAVAEALDLLYQDVPVVPLFFSAGAFAYRTAIYDRWVFVKGNGILDKRSFLPSETSTPPPTERAGGEERSGSGLSFGWVALGLLAAAIVLGIVGAVRRGQ